MNIRDTVFTVVDIETTGGSHAENHIIEIGAVKVLGGKMVDTFHSLVYSSRRIPFYISWMTGITNSMVNKAPKFSDIAEELWTFLNGGIFVAHNVNFDYDFMKHEFMQTKCPSFTAPRMCTIRLAKRIFPGFTHYNLRDLSRNLGVTRFKAHRALDDSLATAKILLLMFNRLSEHGINTLRDLERIYQNSPGECQDFFSRKPLTKLTT